MKKLLTICLLFVASAASGQCPFGAAPVYTTPPDANGETQVQAGWDTTIADPVNGPSAVGGTLVLCRRIFFNDNPLAKTQGGKNAAVSINHLTGSGTSLFNQDRALWVSTSNPVGDTAIHKSITGIQVETDIYGAPSFAGRGPDSEIAGSFQVGDWHTGNVAGSNFGTNAIRATVYRWGGNTTSGWTGIQAFAQNNSAAPGDLTNIMGASFWAEDTMNLNPNLLGIGLYLPNYPVARPGHRLRYNWALYISDFGSDFAHDYNIRSYGTAVSGQNYFGGPIVAGSEIVTGQSTNTDLAGTGVMPFSYAFAGRYQQPPICVVSDTTTGAAALIQVTKTGFVVQGVTGNTFNYICIGRQNQ